MCIPSYMYYNISAKLRKVDENNRILLKRLLEGLKTRRKLYVLSMFFAQVLGCYLFLVSLAMLVHQARFRKTLNEFASSHFIVTFSGGLSLFLGLVIVVSHNIWVAMWPVVITLIGWFAVLQGIIRIFWPEHFTKMVKDMTAKNGYLIWSWIWLIIGAYLIWMGFAGPTGQMGG